MLTGEVIRQIPIKEKEMKRNPLIRIIFMGVGLLGLAGWGGVPLSLRAVSHGTSARTAISQPPHQVADYGNLPLAFEPNQGQTDPQVQFLSRGRGYVLFVTPQGAVLSLKKPGVRPRKFTAKGSQRRAQSLPAPDNPVPTVLRLETEGVQTGVKFESQEMLPGVSNYFIGKDPSKWIKGVPHYSKVTTQGLYPGVDMVYYGNQGKLEYDFVVQPGADPGVIRLGVEGAQGVQINGQGDLELDTKQGKVVFRSPTVYQETRGGKSPVTGRYKLKEGNKVGFEVEGYDKTKPLVIDPILDYSTYLGGSNTDWAFGVAADSSGDAYVTGLTQSANFPTQGSPQALAGTENAFITEFDPSGTALVFSDYLGGNNEDQSWGIALDSSGDIFVTGQTNSINFPTTSNAIQANLNGGTNAFVAKLPPGGGALDYSTYLGGSQFDYGYAIAVDSCGNMYITGSATSPDFPLLNPIQSTLGSSSGGNAFVTKISAGGALAYSTYLGGSGSNGDAGFAIALDGSGDAWVAGYTASSNFPTLNAFQSAFGGFQNGFITEVNPAGTAWAYSTYFGGLSQTSYITPQTGGHVFDVCYGIALDGSRNVYVTGWTISPNFPTKNPIQPTNTNPFGMGFVSELAAGGASLVYSTYLGGTGDSAVDTQDEGNGIRVDESGNAYVAGETGSFNFPMVNPLQPSNAQNMATGNNTAFVTEVAAGGTSYLFSTYWGGSTEDGAEALTLDPADNIYVAGYSFSNNFPVTNAFQAGLAGAIDAFVFKIAQPPPAAPVTQPVVQVAPASPPPASQTLGAGTGNVPVLKVSVSNPSGETVQLTGATLTESGTGADSTGIASLTVYAIIGGSPVSLTQVSSPFASSNSPIVPLPNVNIPPSSSQTLLVTFNFGPTASLGTYTLSLANSCALSGHGLTSDKGIQLTGALVNGAVLTVALPTATFTPTSTPTTTTPTVTPVVNQVTIGNPYPNPVAGPLSIPVIAPAGFTAHWTVFTLGFRKVYERAQTFPGTDGTLSWNLVDNQDVPVANGLYYIRVDVTGGVSGSRIVKALVTR